MSFNARSINELLIQCDTEADIDEGIHNFLIYMNDQNIQNSQYSVNDILEYIQNNLPNHQDITCSHEPPKENDTDRVHTFYIIIPEVTSARANTIITEFTNEIGLNAQNLFPVNNASQNEQNTQPMLSNNVNSFNYYASVRDDQTIYSDTSPENSPQPNTSK